VFDDFPILRERWRLMLDEPSQGLAPLLVREVGLLRRLKQEGLTILLVEQNTRLALAVADHVLVLHKGAVMVCRNARGVPPGGNRAPRQLSGPAGRAITRQPCVASSLWICPRD
jgi:branched-chain amino acid transport system ATP-binding protein